MEIDITDFFNNATPSYYSASKLELGQDAGRITWENALEASNYLGFNMIDTDDKREAFRGFVRSSGGWTWDEINSWNHKELNALFLQWVSGDMREADLTAGMDEEDWEEYEKKAQAGQIPSNIFKGMDGRIYFQLD